MKCVVASEQGGKVRFPCCTSGSKLGCLQVDLLELPTYCSFQHSHDITTRVAHLHTHTGALSQPGGSVDEAEVVVINDTRCIDNTPRRIQDTKSEDATT